MRSRRDVLGRRVIAALLDVAVIFGLFVLFAVEFGSAHARVHGGQTNFSVSLNGAPAVVSIALVVAYYFVLELRFGRTLGKLLNGLRAVSVDGGPLTARKALVRTIGRVIDLLPVLYLIGFIALLVSGSPRQRIGDRLAGTTVLAR